MSADERSSLYLRSRSSDSLKPQMVFELFELVGVLRVRPRVSQQFSKDDIKRLPSIEQAVWHKDSKYNLMVLLCSNGSLLLRGEERGRPPVIKQISWFQNPAKCIRTITLDPSGSWVVCACMNSCLYVVPVTGVVMSNTHISSEYWSTRDITLILRCERRGLPSSIVWWHSVDDLDIGIIGTELGEVLFVDLRLKMMVASVEVKESIKSLELMQDKQHETTALLINTISGDTVQMQLECKSMRKASFEQMRSPVSASFTTSIAVAMGYETLSTRTIPVESVFLGMGDLQDKIPQEKKSKIH